MSHPFSIPIEEDDFGASTITIPENLMVELGWSIGDQLDYDLQDNVLTFKKYDE